MAGDLPKSYSPAASEKPVRDAWEASGAFHADPGGRGEPFSIVIPPPNVTAALHLGHALNNTLQDVLVRVHRMRGFNTLWMPGTDHAGIATQAVVEKRLLRQGRKRTDFTRAQFVARVQEWKDEYEAVILDQLKALGCSCDWQRVRFTMDPMCTRAVREAFFLLYRDGLIERGKRLVNWDPAALTALADDEVEMVEVDGQMWYLRYPLADGGGFVTVATTRPETMLGDTAVAVNPADPRASGLVGRMLRLPIVNRLVPIIADDYVVMPGASGSPMAEFATGFLKVTPAHDPNDWEIGRRHGLPVINVLAPDATISRDHGWPAEEFESGRARDAEPLLGLSREEAREQVARWFRRNDLLQEVRNYRHSVGHSYRSHVPIEPYLSDQWFVRVTDDRMRGEALRAMDESQREGAAPPRTWTKKKAREGDGELRFFPARYARSFQAWHENLRDWCISRQLWWGHRIPVWSRPVAAPDPEAGFSPEDAAALAAWDRLRRDLRERIAAAPQAPGAPDAAEKARRRELARRAGCSAEAVAAALEQGALRACVRREDDREAVAQLEAAGYQQDPDVLDTWFSSALWPIATMGWPEPREFPETRGLLEAFNPTSVLCTARDIITLWVSRMVMFNRCFRDGTLPFRDVSIHPMIQDGAGQRMSKSLGNGVDPRDIIRTHGADGLRFTLVHVATATQDVRLPVDVVCPYCGHAFHPKEIVSSAGHRVAAAMQQCPSCERKMVSGYGAAAGLAAPTAEHPLAINTSSAFDQGRNFANKLWNAARFALGKLRGAPAPGAPGAERALVDRWILTRLHRTMHEVEDALAQYQFSAYADAMYNLVWRDFCDWYLEAIKPTVGERPGQQRVLHAVLDAILRMLHPVCPFVTESLWPHVQALGEAGVEGVVLPAAAAGAPLATAAWPDISCSVDDDEAAQAFVRLQALVGAIRNLRSEHRVPPRRRITLQAPRDLVDLAAQGEGAVETLAGLARIAPLAGGRPPPGAVTLALEGSQLWLSDLVESLDAGAERERLRKLQQEKQKELDGLRRRLGNESYRVKAPPHLVAQTEDQLARAEADLAAAERALAVLEGRP